MAQVISMEQSLPEKGESINDGETSSGNDLTIVPTDVEWTSPGSDWVLQIPMEPELRSSLDDHGVPKEKQKVNPTEVPFPKVPVALRKNPRRKDCYFDPTIISFGPYHHRKRELKEIDGIKTEAMLKFIKESESGKSFPEFYYEVRKMNDFTRACYVDCSKEEYCDHTLALMMLRDGCLISYLLDILVHKKGSKVIELFVNYGSFLGYASVIRDMILLENQVPLAVLELLMSLRYNDKKDVPKMIKQVIYQVFWCRSREYITEFKEEKSEDRFPLQCIQKEFSKTVYPMKKLACFGLGFCSIRNPVPNTSENEHNLEDDYPSYRSLSELKAQGIHFKPIQYSLRSISFSDAKFTASFFYAQLKLPPLSLSYDGIILLNNLIAFELSAACEPENAVITSYINFLKAIIASPADVKELRSKRILLNYVGNDEEMFKFFREISSGSFVDFPIFINIREDIEKHCRSNCRTNVRTWVAEIIYKYFRNPWSTLGLFAAIAVVVLTFLQTYFTIHPVKD